MRLGELIAGEAVRRVHGDTECEITGLSHDSRLSRPGDLFFSLARDKRRGRSHLEQALDRGARAVVVGGWDGEAARPAVTVIECDRPRLLMGTAASRFHDAPSRRLDLIGVTGTSGKTTSTYLLASIFEAAGFKPGMIGTVGTFIGGRRVASGLTTPESADFESALARMEREGVSHVAAEVSSIGIEERRVEALNFRACLFTNLGRDHLDYHGTLEDYFAAKQRLFTELLPKSARAGTIAVARGDDPVGQRLLSAVKGRKVSFGLRCGLDVYAEEYTNGINGVCASIKAFGKSFEVSSPLLGEINLLNILGASALSVALGIETGAVAEGVRRCPGAPGRLEAVEGLAGVKVLVDYAHKPDALAAVLDTLRALSPGRLICVFGCGGDRDHGKRPIMGEIAGRRADIAILTSDNPRTENPLAIIAEVEGGLARSGLDRIGKALAGLKKGYLVEPDRRGAIAMALEIAREGDVVVIAGKGHEDYQLIGSRRLEFDDRAVAREVMAGFGRARCG